MTVKNKAVIKIRGHSELVSESTSWVVAVILESRSPGSVVIKKRGKQRILDRNLPE